MIAIGDIHPALREFREVILLSGFSGATVALVRDRTLPFVRKVANQFEGNSPLREQAFRQRALAKLVQESANIPEVLDEGEHDGYYYFDMAFVPSRDAINFLSNASFDNVADFADRIERLMICIAAAPPVGDHVVVPRRAVLDEKLARINERTNARHSASLAPLMEAVDLLDTLVPSAAVTAVHGDLTFENILVDRRGALCLIDTIPSPFDHYWLDWSKLFQECEGLWHAHRGRPLARGVTWWLRQRFLGAASRLDPAYPPRHFVLLGLTFARILPYAKTESDLAFVERRVSECGRAALEILK